MAGNEHGHDGHGYGHGSPDKPNTRNDNNVTVSAEPIPSNELNIYSAEDEVQHAVASARHVLEQHMGAYEEVTLSFEATFRLHTGNAKLSVRVHRRSNSGGAVIDVSAASLEDAVQEFLRRVRFNEAHPPIDFIS